MPQHRRGRHVEQQARGRADRANAHPVVSVPSAPGGGEERNMLLAMVGRSFAEAIDSPVRENHSPPNASRAGQQASSSTLQTSNTMTNPSTDNGPSLLLVQVPPKKRQPSTNDDTCEAEEFTLDDFGGMQHDGGMASFSDFYNSGDEGGAEKIGAKPLPSSAVSCEVLDEDLLKLVPLDDKGELTSVGSIGHAAGDCNPCAFVRARKGCAESVACQFCHLEHNKTKGRPRKSKRHRQKVAAARMLDAIEHSPDAVDAEAMDWPSPLADNQGLQNMVSAELRRRQDAIRTRGHESGRASSSSQPHRPCTTSNL